MGGKNVKITIVERVLRMVTPDLCYSCGKIGSTFCCYCKYDIIHEASSVCFWCGMVCSQGVCELHASFIDGVTTIGVYEGGLKRALEYFKFHNDAFAATQLSELLVACAPQFPEDTMVIPVPTLRKNVRRRGYDQAFLLAKKFASTRGYSLSPIIQRHAGHVQHRLHSRQEREVSIRGAFGVTPNANPPKVAVIVDDIVTTGATINEMAKVLRGAGVEKVFAIAVARVN